MDGPLFWPVVTSGTTLVWLAYNEPEQFKRNLPIFIAIPSLVWFAFAVWMWAIRWVRYGARDILDATAFRKLSALLDGVEPSPPILMGAVVGIIVFFTVLKLWVCEMKGRKPK